MKPVKIHWLFLDLQGFRRSQRLNDPFLVGVKANIQPCKQHEAEWKSPKWQSLQEARGWVKITNITIIETIFRWLSENHQNNNHWNYSQMAPLVSLGWRSLLQMDCSGGVIFLYQHCDWQTYDADISNESLFSYKLRIRKRRSNWGKETVGKSNNQTRKRKHYWKQKSTKMQNMLKTEWYCKKQPWICAIEHIGNTKH